MRTFWQGRIDGRDSRCPGTGRSEGTCVAPVTGAAEASRACLVRPGGPGISSLPGHIGMGCATALTWAPYVTLASDGPRAPSRRYREFRWLLGSAIAAADC